MQHDHESIQNAGRSRVIDFSISHSIMFWLEIPLSLSASGWMHFNPEKELEANVMAKGLRARCLALRVGLMGRDANEEAQFLGRQPSEGKPLRATSALRFNVLCRKIAE